MVNPASMNGQFATLLDWQHLHQMSDNCKDFELELLAIFVEDSQIHIDALKQAIAQGDYDEAIQQAHHLKGASANVGAVTMQQVAHLLEQKARQAELQGAEHLVFELQLFLQKIQEFLHSQQS